MLNIIKPDVDGPTRYDPAEASLAEAADQLSGADAMAAAAALVSAVGRGGGDKLSAFGTERYELGGYSSYGGSLDYRQTDQARSFQPASLIPEDFEVREPSMQDAPETHLAVHRATGSMRRLVTIRKPGGSEQQERLRDAVRRVQVLQHDGIARVHGVYEDFRSTTMVVENCSGGTVYDRILQKQYFAEQETAVLTRHVLQSLEYMHSSGLAHGHLTPDSFRFHTDAAHASLKLVDFGLELKVQLWDALQAVETVGADRERRRAACLHFFEACRIVFSAPEIVKPMLSRRKAQLGENNGGTSEQCSRSGLDGDLLSEAIDAHLERTEELDPRQLPAADVWSVGAITFLLLCGYPPFFAPCRFAILSRIEKTDYAFDPPFWSKISEEAKDFVQGLLRADPADRMTVSDALRHPWIQSLADTSPSGSMLSSFALNLRRFYRTSLIESFAANSLASKLTYAELYELHVRCQEADSQRSGFFTASDLRQVLVRLGHADIAEAVAMCFSRSLRHPGESYIDYAALVDSVRARRERLLETELWTAFCSFADADSQGSAPNGSRAVVGAKVHGRLPLHRLQAYLHVPCVRQALVRDGLEDVSPVTAALQSQVRLTVEEALIGTMGGAPGSPEVDFIEIASEVVRQLPPMAPTPIASQGAALPPSRG